MTAQLDCSSLLETYFAAFRENMIGNDQTFSSPYGEQNIVYADWTATGRAYRPIEQYIQLRILPFIANTHTSTTYTGRLMTAEYERAKRTIKQHVGANNSDVLLFCGSGMTSAVNKLQRMLGWRLPERLGEFIRCDGLQIDSQLRPVVFVTHMEHHSNHISWIETIAEVEIIDRAADGNADLGHLGHLLQLYKHRKYKVAAITACSNVTGIETRYHEIARMMHESGGWCFVDFACSAPYVDINMHPPDEDSRLDAIYFSPHKFAGGAATPGILIFNEIIYKNTVPDCPGGGATAYTNPWNERDYKQDIEEKEDAGTPTFVGAIKAALCIRLKEDMGVDNMLRREKELLSILFDGLAPIPNIQVLEGNHQHRLGIVSFLLGDAHYELVVKILNDRFGIQSRGGCSCAGPYGHFLLNVDRDTSRKIRSEIRSGNLLAKPGWIRISIHPTMTNQEMQYIVRSIESTAINYSKWINDYEYDPVQNEYVFSSYLERYFD